MNNPKVSVIIPCYGVESFLARCVDSLLNQTLLDIELILVDDESPDRVPEMCDEYARKDKRVKVIHKKNAGLGYARNSGLEVATGEYVAFVDGDDFVELDMYQTLYEDAIKENADVVFCNFQRENSDGTWLDCYEMKQRQVFKGNETIELMLDIVASAPYVKVDRKYQMSVWHGIYRRSIIEKYHIRFLSERQVTSEDMPFDVDYLSKCKTIVYRTECFYHYCLNGGSLTAKFFPEKMERYKTLYRYIKPQLQMYGEDGLARANRFYIGMIRSQILHLFKTDRKDKYQIIQRLSSDPIWKEIMNDFKYSWLPVYAAILQWLLLHKCFLFLKIYCKLYNRYR